MAETTKTLATAHPQASGWPAPNDALDAAIRAAILAEPLREGPDGRVWAVVPERAKLAELEDRYALPPWPEASLFLDDRRSLVTYTNRFSQPEKSVIFADYSEGTITTALDWHPHNQSPAFGLAAAAVHRATLKLFASEEFARWDAMAGKMHDQAEFARFLEENAADIMAPDAASMIELSRDFEATVGQTYKAATRLDNGDRKLVFTSETNVQSGVTIPQRFTLSIPVYNGEEPEDLNALFRWRAAPGGGVQLGFVWHRLEYRRRARFAAIANQVAEETGLPVVFGGGA